MVVLLGMGDGGGLGAPLRLIKEFICADSACLPRSFLGTLEATFGAEVDKARGQLWGHLKKDVFLYSSSINMLRRLFGSCPRNQDKSLKARVCTQLTQKQGAATRQTVEPRNRTKIARGMLSARDMPNPMSALVQPFFCEIFRWCG
jgi:hypothetical protein